MIKAGRMDSPKTIRDQVARYQSEFSGNSSAMKWYIEGALLMRNRGPVGDRVWEAWREEYFRKDSSDRDQIAFAGVAARMQPAASVVRMMDQCVEVGAGKFCHWYRGGSVARLTRTRFEKQ